MADVFSPWRTCHFHLDTFDWIPHGLKVMFVLICIHASLTDFPLYSTWNNLEKKNNSNPSPSKSSHWQMPLWPSDLDGGSMASFVSSTGCAGHYGTRNRCQMGQPSFIGREQKVVTIVKLKSFFNGQQKNKKPGNIRIRRLARSALYISSRLGFVHLWNRIGLVCQQQTNGLLNKSSKNRGQQLKERSFSLKAVL